MALLGAASLATLGLLLLWQRRGWPGFRWALRVRAVISVQVLVVLVVGAMPIFVVALLAFGRESLGLPAALATAVAEIGVVVAAIKGRS